MWPILAGVAVLIIALAVAARLYFARRTQAHTLTDKDTIVLSEAPHQHHGRRNLRRHAENSAQRFPAAIAFPECALQVAKWRRPYNR